MKFPAQVLKLIFEEASSDLLSSPSETCPPLASLSEALPLLDLGRSENTIEATWTLIPSRLFASVVNSTKRIGPASRDSWAWIVSQALNRSSEMEVAFVNPASDCK